MTTTTDVTLTEYVIRHGKRPRTGPTVSRHAAAVVRGSRGCILGIERTDGFPVVVSIERFPMAIEPVAARILELRGSVLIDSEGLGDALWMLLGRATRRRGVRLYAKHGVARAELSKNLLVAVARREFSFAPGLQEEEAMRKALLEMTRDVREDGPGSELCVALSLALSSRGPARPRIL